MEGALKLPETMTTSEFLNWDAPGKLWQLVEGVPQAMAPGTRTHGRIQARLAALIEIHLLGQGSSCSVVTTPGILPRALADMNFRIPDLGVTCAAYKEEQLFLPEPMLLIEILSPSNRAETWSNVWTYTTIPSVQEILVVRSDEIGAELLRRQRDGTWPDTTLSLREGPLALESIGFTCDLTAVYRGTRLLNPPA